MILGRLSLVYGTALIVCFFSEFFFFNEGPVIQLVSGIADGSAFLTVLELGFWYSVPAFYILWLAERFNASHLLPVFLIGAIAGYMIEGLVVPVMYFELPFSLVWTSLSWHPLVNVVFGLWIMQQILRTSSFLRNLSLMSLTGLLWGAWSTWPVGSELEDGSGIMEFLPLMTFATFAFFATGMLIVGQFLITLHKGRFVPSKFEVAFFLLFSILLYVTMFLAAGILAIVLPIVILLLLAVLRLHSKRSDCSVFIKNITSPLALSKYIAILAMPITATLTYAIFIYYDATFPYWIPAVLLVIIACTLCVAACLPRYRG